MRKTVDGRGFGSSAWRNAALVFVRSTEKHAFTGFASRRPAKYTDTHARTHTNKLKRGGNMHPTQLLAAE